MELNRITLGQIIRSYKAKTTYQIRFCASFAYFKWQRNYYEHTIRNQDELNHIREYVINNPSQWQFDRENTDRIHDKAYDDYWGSFEEAIYGKTKNNFRKIMLLQSPNAYISTIYDIVGLTGKKS